MRLCDKALSNVEGTFSFHMSSFMHFPICATYCTLSTKAIGDMIENFIRYYNTRRVQRKLGILTPMEKHLLYLAA